MSALLVVAVAASLLVGVPAAPDPDRYRPPVEAPVVDPFRPPPAPWLPGNRGIEYATPPGTPVGAIGPGTVSFAGPVAGRRIVTVFHPDGLRSSYVGLAAIGVAPGARVRAGQPVGLSGDRLHLGVRRGDAYLDPASLWGRAAGRWRVHLVPWRTAPSRDRPSLGRAERPGYSGRPAHRPVSRHQATPRLPNGRLRSAGGASVGAPPNRWRGAFRVGTRRHHE
ncbi:MAG: M23 family metallopeptidase, partial [Acidimicrobiales bacterium]|nr:M23 family metallopeptidase [Acidimicrobiales bacterium]